MKPNLTGPWARAPGRTRASPATITSPVVSSAYANRRRALITLAPGTDADPIGEPVEQRGNGVGESVVRAVDGPGLSGLVEDELFLRSRLVVGALGMAGRHQVVVLTVNDQERAGDLVDDSLEGERLQPLPGVLEVLG